jgi:hypothetical protein
MAAVKTTPTIARVKPYERTWSEWFDQMDVVVEELK